MSKRPLILIGTDGHKGDEKKPREGVYAAYVDAVIGAGGLPLILPARAELLDDYLDRADGILLPGGDDFDPCHYGQKNQGSETPFLDETRVARDLALLRTWFEADRPVFGICAGMQLMNVALGGSMVQDIGDKLPVHRQKGTNYAARHPVHLEGGSRFFQILGKNELETNSSHHQALDRIAAPLRVTGRSSDGVVEAVEAPAKRFYMGVQWHPEADLNEDSKKLFKAFISACNLHHAQIGAAFII